MKVAYLDPFVAERRSPYFLTTNPNLPKRIRNTSMRKHECINTNQKHTFLLLSSLPKYTPQRHFGRGGLLNGVCGSCAEGCSRERAAPYHPQNTATAVLLFEVLYTGGRSVNTTLAGGDCAG